MGLQRSLGILVAGAMLCACTAVPSGPAPSGSASSPMAVTVPACEDLFDPEEIARDYYGEPDAGLELLDTSSWGHPGADWTDPATKPIMLQAADPVRCWWGIPNSDGSLELTIAPLDAALATTLVGVLESGGYPDVPITSGVDGYGGADVFGSISVVYAVAGNVWFTSMGAQKPPTSVPRS